MTEPGATREDVAPGQTSAQPPLPAVVVVFRDGTPVLEVHPITGPELRIGRAGCDIVAEDDRVSREHASIRYGVGRWTVTDLDSRNGTFVDGERTAKHITADSAVVRAGHTLCVLIADARQLVGEQVQIENDMVVGPTLANVLSRIRRIARVSDTLLISGDSGSGKELAARTFHLASPNSKGPFVAVNCATVATGVAERLLFGAVKGAFSGATADAEGYVQAADKGTLFLDELVELDSAVQAKLLRVFESKKVMALGASRSRPVDLRVCSATHADLRTRTASGDFREDLYFRIGRPAVALPPLRERREEIPVHVCRELERIGLTADPRLVERCLVLPWPGNVRELRGEVARAGHEAIADERSVVVVDDLSVVAGAAMAGTPTAAEPATAPDKPRIEAALAAHKGNVSAAARELGVHRTQLRRWISRLNIELPDGG